MKQWSLQSGSRIFQLLMQLVHLCSYISLPNPLKNFLSNYYFKNHIYLGSSLGLGLGSFDLEFLELLDEVFGTEVDDVEEVLEVEVVALFPAYLFSLGSS